MLREIEHVRQIPGEERRRWFTDSQYFDLYVWYDAEDRLTAFQLCYDTLGDQHALSWRNGTWKHNRVDSGEGTPLKSQTPLLVADGVCDADTLEQRFAASCAEIDVAVARFVSAKLAAYRG